LSGKSGWYSSNALVRVLSKYGRSDISLFPNVHRECAVADKAFGSSFHSRTLLSTSVDRTRWQSAILARDDCSINVVKRNLQSHWCLANVRCWHTNDVPNVRGGVDNTLSSSANADELSKTAAIDNPAMCFIISSLALVYEQFQFNHKFDKMLSFYAAALSRKCGI
jgi:hypothetical protein